MLEDHKLMYSSGHNMVIYNIEDRSQSFLAGKDGTEGITCVSISPSKKYLAICERGERAICMIYDVAGQKFRKKLPDQEHECSDYYSREFLACAFSFKNEKNHLVTLTGEPDWLVILWQWDKTKILASYSVGVQ